MPLLKWYLSHGLKVTTVHKYLKYEPGKPFEWFTEEVSQARHDRDNDPSLKQLDDTHKLKGNSFYGKMIEDLVKHLKTTFTTTEELVDESFRSPWKKSVLCSRSRSASVKSPLRCHTNAVLPFIDQ